MALPLHLRDTSIGLNVSGTRVETDSMGRIDVPADRYWGAQTQRSLEHFSIGNDRMPMEVYHAYGIVKKAAAQVNAAGGRLTALKAGAIIQACDEVIAGELDAHFPLFVWQTGSGTQSNMNINEVVSNRAIQLLGGTLGSKNPVHPNDDVNMGMSSNDSFPTAMHIATLTLLDKRLLPELDALATTIEEKAGCWMDVVKIGRTHLEDAVPLTVGQEWSGYAHQIRETIANLKLGRAGLFELAIGGTAVGTGLNAPKGFSVDMANAIAQLTGEPYVTAPNKFSAQGTLDAMVRMSAALRGVAVALMKIANDMRWLASGPRCGLGELRLPENEPGSSIMPGKVNPTQCEALVMIAIQVIGDDTAVAFAGSQGNFELNAMRPIVINNVLHAIRILSDGCQKFRQYSVEGTELNLKRIREMVSRSIMLVTALSPDIGYDKASAIAHVAMEQDMTLRDAALKSGYIDEQTFDRLADPMTMIGHGVGGA
ncbi:MULTISPECIES: class II fumarate hydratase [Gluconobacter]|uniref:class II fumarate hydratase n=1 Tax=Gluconobacter TaxID=441 RepID=UPI001B8BCA99|nr:MULTISPECIES: class II fumarate hydratase [Gluconobacter]MBS1023185.1 class II fumarate hydratase [Gluconobacter cerinus]MBS1025461.1 class II fumarate hydratase [Gluconobacter cerinus]MBS1086701.1 class II fumarate hydratase [Gluconobacter sphaericus]MBS1100457.1 class II fumarate hydratase [Gluconobacter sphaericus]